MRFLLVLLLTVIEFSSGLSSYTSVNLNLQLNSSKYYVDNLFVSMSMPHMNVRWRQMPYDHGGFRNLCKALAPTSIRVYFNPLFYKGKWVPVFTNATTSTLQDVTVEIWERFYDFMKYIGWDLSIDFTNTHRTANGRWDDRNAKAFLDYASKNEIPIPDFQLGNEPQNYRDRINYQPAPQLVQDYKDLQILMKKYPMYSKSTLVGPETTTSTSPVFFKPFMAAGGCNVVDEIAFHQYYRSLYQKPTYADFLNITVMNWLNDQLHSLKNQIKSLGCDKPSRLSETSSIAGGLPGVADRFVAGFLWLDKLGLAALYGITRVYRFHLWGKSYSLFGGFVLAYPDYYLTLLYKRLVEGPVLNVSSDVLQVRAYANCVRPQEKYKIGAVVIYLLNTLEYPIKINIEQFSRHKVDVYWFTSAGNALISQYVKVNDVLMNSSGNQPTTFTPRNIDADDISMPGHSFGFIVIPEARASVCTSNLSPVLIIKTAASTNEASLNLQGLESSLLSFFIFRILCARFT
ncbi:heparanase [Biomphalaria pfeifferi]|uniref:Heparanase n=1 Tax=Biomphalaria pfeifferi TaxID=112525 RepID=A0AAD8C7K5_BIOPF|nr:heparanase [Biomphalaria pfeifferi]